MKRLPLLAAFLIAIVCPDLSAQTKIELQPNDTIQTILQKNTGLVVELRMKSGEKMGGKIEKLGDKVVYLSALTGAEFYDAVVDISHISAVVMRTKK